LRAFGLMWLNCCFFGRREMGDFGGVLDFGSGFVGFWRMFLFFRGCVFLFPGYSIYGLILSFSGELLWRE